MKMLRIGLLLGLMGVFSACGEDLIKDKEGDLRGDAPSYVGVMKSTTVTAAAGGELEAGAATLNVPAGAVAGDLEISVAVESSKGKPNEKNILVDIYDFGPDGTQFLKPVELTFDMKGIKADMSKGKIEVAFLDGDKWNVLPTTIKDGKASAETTHFTPFTIIFTVNDDGDVVQEAGACTEDFDACGGDVTGAWNFSGACATFPNPYEVDNPEQNPFAACEDKPTFAFTLDLTGTVNFAADGTFELHNMTTSSAEAKIPASCLETVATNGGGMLTGADVCEAIGDDGVLEANGDCTLLAAEPKTETDDDTGTWSTEGNMLTIMSDDADEPDAGAGDEDKPAEYCVNGNMLSVRILSPGDTVSEVRYYATRQ